MDECPFCHRMKVAGAQAKLTQAKFLLSQANISFQQQNYQVKIVEISNQAAIGTNNHPAISEPVKFKANAELVAGLPVKISIDID